MNPLKKNATTDDGHDDVRRELSDAAIARIKTAVPAWWGAVVTWLLLQLAAHLPAEVLGPLSDLLTSAPAQALVVAVATLLWHWLWGWLGRLVPDWVLRLAVGSTQTAVYPGTAGAREFDELLEEKARAGLGGDRLAHPLTDSETQLIRDVRTVEGRGAPARRHDDEPGDG